MNSKYYLLNKILNFSTPFQYSLIHDVYSSEVSKLLFHYCKNINKWHFSETNFYEQYECYLGENSPLPEEISGILKETSIKFLKSWAEEHFKRPLKDDYEIVVHKLIKDQYIDVHTDFHENVNICRFVVQLDDNNYSGGELSLIDNNNESVLIPNRNNLGLTFIPSIHSFHKVNKVLSGERFSIVYTFYGR